MTGRHRLAAGLAGAATLVAVGGWAVQVALPGGTTRWVVFALLWWLAPVLTVSAVAAWAAAAGLVGIRRAVVVVALAAIGYAAAAVAAAGWNLAVESDDAGGDLPAFAALAIPVALAGLPFGAAAIAVVLDAVGSERMPRRRTRIAAGTITGLLLAPLAGLAGATPLFTILPPLVVLLAIALRHAEHEPPPARRGQRRLLPLAALLAVVALLVGVVATVVRVAGGAAGLLAGGRADDASTGALVAGNLAALPLLAAIAIVAGPRAPRPVWTLAVPLVTIGALSVVQAAAPSMGVQANGDAAASPGLAPVVVGVLSFAVASGAFVWGRLPLTASSRSVIAAVATGAGGLLGLFAAPFLPIAVPFGALAVLLVLRGLRRDAAPHRGAQPVQPSDVSSNAEISSTSK